MRFAGIDIGSRTIELVVVDENGHIQTDIQADTGFDPMAEAKRLVNETSFDWIMATGYGRNLFEISFDAPTVTEIKAHATGGQGIFSPNPVPFSTSADRTARPSPCSKTVKSKNLR